MILDDIHLGDLHTQRSTFLSIIFICLNISYMVAPFTLVLERYVDIRYGKG
jgi:hypothetical protein